MAAEAFSIGQADWQKDASAIRRVRERVFIREQGVRPDEEWDHTDDRCLHFLAREGSGQAIGTARLTPDGHIGRMAVLRDWRGRGVGRALLEGVIEAARRRGLRRLVADAQVQALGFYLKAGFRPEGPEFLEVRIPHQRVELELEPRG